MRLCTFNVRRDVDADAPNDWSGRRDAVIETLREIAPDVIALQEPLARQYDDIRESLSAYEWYGVGRRGGRDGEFCPIGWRPERFANVARETRWLSERPDEPGSVGWDAAFPRIATRVVLESTPEPAFPAVSVWNTHFDHEGKIARISSAELLRAWVSADERAVLVGDFNSSPGDEPYAILAESFADARQVAASTSGPVGTFHGFTREPDRRIDHAFLWGDLEVTTHETVTAAPGGQVISDHFPVIAELTREG